MAASVLKLIMRVAGRFGLDKFKLAWLREGRATPARLGESFPSIIRTGATGGSGRTLLFRTDDWLMQGLVAQALRRK